MRWPNDEKLAKNVDEIDLILGGHDHDYTVKQVSELRHAKTGVNVNKTLGCLWFWISTQVFNATRKHMGFNGREQKIQNLHWSRVLKWLLFGIFRNHRTIIIIWKNKKGPCLWSKITWLYRVSPSKPYFGVACLSVTRVICVFICLSGSASIYCQFQTL